jgi:hypothetical protein
MKSTLKLFTAPTSGSDKSEPTSTTVASWWSGWYTAAAVAVPAVISVAAYYAYKHYTVDNADVDYDDEDSL